MRNPHYRSAIHAAVVSVCQSCHCQPFFPGFCRVVKIQKPLLLAEYWPAAQIFHLGTSPLLPSLLLQPGLYKQHLNGKTSQLVIAGKILANLLWFVLCAQPFLVALIRSSARVICCQKAQLHWNKSAGFNDFISLKFHLGLGKEWKIFWSCRIFSFNLTRMACLFACLF